MGKEESIRAALDRLEAAIAKANPQKVDSLFADLQKTAEGTGLRFQLEPNSTGLAGASLLVTHEALWGASFEARASREALQQELQTENIANAWHSPLLFSGGQNGGLSVRIIPAVQGGQRLLPALLSLDEDPCLSTEIYRRLEEEALRNPMTWRKGLSQEVLGEMDEESRRAFAAFCTKAWLDMDGTLRDVFLSKSASRGFFPDENGGMHVDTDFSRDFASIFDAWLENEAPELIGKTSMPRKAAMELWRRLAPEENAGPAPGR